MSEELANELQFTQFLFLFCALIHVQVILLLPSILKYSFLLISTFFKYSSLDLIPICGIKLSF